jgi:hypothetical protein
MGEAAEGYSVRRRPKRVEVSASHELAGGDDDQRLGYLQTNSDTARDRRYRDRRNEVPDCETRCRFDCRFPIHAQMLEPYLGRPPRAVLRGLGKQK